MRSLLLSCLLLGACGAHPVRCDQWLRPINPPAAPTAGADPRAARAPASAP